MCTDEQLADMQKHLFQSLIVFILGPHQGTGSQIHRDYWTGINFRLFKNYDYLL